MLADDLREAFRRQCKAFGADAAFMMWHFSGELADEVLLDVMKEEGYHQ
jgi:hypothetical protein